MTAVGCASFATGWTSPKGSIAVKSSEYQAIMTAIKSSSNRSEAAKKLGISPRSLRYKMAQFRERGLPTLAAG